MSNNPIFSTQLFGLTACPPLISEKLLHGAMQRIAEKYLAAG